MRGLSVRRHHDERMKKKVRSYYGGYIDDKWKPYLTLTEEEKERHTGIAAQSKKQCSCWMCGNPRKWDNELTIQERKQMENDKYEMEIN